MMKKITALLVALVIAFGSISMTAYAQDASESVYEMNKKQTAAAISYITEMYIERYPEFGLVNEYGGEPDKKVLSDLALSLTENCTSDTEKAQVLFDWVVDNTQYDTEYEMCSYPIDVYYEGRAACHGFAMLFSRLMRIAGIPAVVFDGLRGDMKDTVTKENFPGLRRFSGHAWVMAYINKEWRLYDPLWDVVGNTDRNYWESWYFCTHIEGVSPFYDGIDTEMTNDGFGMFYIDGRTIIYVDGQPTFDQPILMMNGMIYKAYQKEVKPGNPDAGFRYLYEPERKAEMINTQAFYDGFFTDMSGTMLFYAEPNGILKSSSTIVFKDNAYYINQGRVSCFSDIESRQFRQGYPIVLVGETIKAQPLILSNGEVDDTPVQYRYSVFAADHPESITIDSDGGITVSEPGAVTILSADEYNS